MRLQAGYCVFVLYLFSLSESVKQCDRSLTSRFLQMKQLTPTILKFLTGKTYWNCASSKDSSLYYLPLTFSYSPVINNACNLTITLYNSTNKPTPYVYEEAEVIDGKYLGFALNEEFSANYYSRCSEDCIIKYRCQMAGKDGGGSSYRVLAPISRKATASATCTACVKVIKNLDPTIDMHYNDYPIT